MTKSAYHQEREYRIYALVHPRDPCCYIGKTGGRRLSAAYSNHICQNVEATCDWFDKEEDRPRLHLLETITANRSQAYRHVVAWVRIFREAGYEILNHEGTLFHAECLQPETRELVERFRAVPLDRILEQTYLEKITAADKPLEEKPETPKPSAQMNLRIRPADRERFLSLCRSHGRNQREGFSLLLDIVDYGDHSACQKAAAASQERLRKLTEENQRLQEKLARRAAPELPEPVRRRLELLPIWKNGMEEFLRQSQQALPPGKPLRQSNYRRFMKRLPPGVAYRYPPEPGVMILRPEAILWGDPLHRACFLVGTEESDTAAAYKFRYYPKEDYLGHPLQAHIPGNRWLVGFRPAKDGAMELILLLPLPDAPPEPQEAMEVPVPPVRKKSLDEQIREHTRGGNL